MSQRPISTTTWHKRVPQWAINCAQHKWVPLMIYVCLLEPVERVSHTLVNTPNVIPCHSKFASNYQTILIRPTTNNTIKIKAQKEQIESKTTKTLFKSQPNFHSHLSIYEPYHSPPFPPTTWQHSPCPAPYACASLAASHVKGGQSNYNTRYEGCDSKRRGAFW